jgi:hypothetical protein
MTQPLTKEQKVKLHSQMKTMNKPPVSFYKWYSEEAQRTLLAEAKLPADATFCAKFEGQTVYLQKWKVCSICKDMRHHFDPYWTTLVFCSSLWNG